ncbi:MAG TPA: VWA domain-containing protein [Bryobacteraceae bacterium]|nr:VWA domain-containing protein [Bryobacteraceae bacterium]
MFAFRRALALGISFCAIALAARAQATLTPDAGARDQPLVFKTKVSLIMVPVVVRDKKGKTVATLHQEDFELFDQGKPQVISSFSIEKSGGKALPPIPMAGRTPVARPGQPPVIAPDRFIGIFIDDVNTKFADISYTRSQLQKFIATRLQPGDRAAIFTTSGQNALDFTGDQYKLNARALKITPHPFPPPPTCPGMSDVQAYRIADLGDGELLQKKGEEAVAARCAQDLSQGLALARRAARIVLDAVEINARIALGTMTNVVRAMSEKPGQRILVIASSGFVRPSSLLAETGALIDRAIRSRVLISTMDARGLVASPGGAPLNPLAEAVRSDFLWEVADGTGGKFIHNTNGLEEGFASVAEAPEVTYMLGFSPGSLNPNGKFHALKVKLKDERGFEVQARHGYFAPDHVVTGAEDFKEEIRRAVFSQEEIHDIPIVMTTESEKISDTQTKLTVVSIIDVAKLHFRQAGGKDANEIEVVSALFDRNGNYIEGVQNNVSLRLVDEVLRSRESAPVPSRAEFKVAPGTYVIRLVARDNEGGMMTAQNGSVEIPETTTTRTAAPPALAKRASAPPDASAILEKGREKALAYARSLPDFVCTEVIHRYRLQTTNRFRLRGEPNPTSSTDWAPIDKLTVRLSFSQQKEHHKLELVDGMPTRLRYDSLDIGVTTTGEFGGMFRHIFEPDVQASFHWESWKKVRNHRVAVYGYTVAVDHSQYFVEHGARGGEVQRAVVGFHGTVAIDSETGDVLHFDYTADHIPAAIQLTRASTAVDFDLVDVGGTPYLLPVRSEMELDGQNSLKNDTEFRAFGRFAVTSTVDFGAGK